jgi:hypothetical protein
MINCIKAGNADHHVENLSVIYTVRVYVRRYNVGILPWSYTHAD